MPSGDVNWWHFLIWDRELAGSVCALLRSKLSGAGTAFTQTHLCRYHPGDCFSSTPVEGRDDRGVAAARGCPVARPQAGVIPAWQQQGKAGNQVWNAACLLHKWALQRWIQMQLCKPADYFLPQEKT